MNKLNDTELGNLQRRGVKLVASGISTIAGTAPDKHQAYEVALACAYSAMMAAAGFKCLADGREATAANLQAGMAAIVTEVQHARAAA